MSLHSSEAPQGVDLSRPLFTCTNANQAATCTCNTRPRVSTYHIVNHSSQLGSTIHRSSDAPVLNVYLSEAIDTHHSALRKPLLQVEFAGGALRCGEVTVWRIHHIAALRKMGDSSQKVTRGTSIYLGAMLRVTRVYIFTNSRIKHGKAKYHDKAVKAHISSM
jgi:hypothetical protein